MTYILKMALLCWIEPFLWYKSMSARFTQKSKKRCIVVLLVYCMLLIVKSLITSAIGNTLTQGISMVIVEFYMISVTVFSFNGRLRDKLLSVFVFNCILIATELLVMKGYAFLLHIDLDAIFQEQQAYNTCNWLIIFIESITCYCFFGSRKLRHLFFHIKERVILIIMIGVILCDLLVKSICQKNQSDITLLLNIVWVGFLVNAFSIVMVLKRKSHYISALQQDINYNLEQKELAEGIECFQYSYSVNMFIMKNLLRNKQYDVLGKYMENAFTDIEKAVLLYNHSNLAIRILISGFIQTAREMRIPFTVRIMVREFGMTDEDICSLLQNLITNGLEAATKVPYDMAFVTLQAISKEDGYEIICSNSCKGKADFSKTSKQDKGKHGFGVGIIDRIAKKYAATITRECLETEREGVWRVTIVIHVFSKKES